MSSVNWDKLKADLKKEEKSRNAVKAQKLKKVQKQGKESSNTIQHNKWQKNREQIALMKFEAKQAIKNGKIMTTSFKSLKVSKENTHLTKILAMDCEYVGVGFDGRDNCLARVSIVNEEAKCIYDKFVKPTEEITDYRTHVSGIRPGDVVNGESFPNVQQEVRKLLAGKIVVGHSLHNDFKVLGLTHPAKFTRDTAKYKPLRKLAGDIQSMPSLKHLATHLLGVQIQQGEHNSISDAKVALRIYLMHKDKWEQDLKKNQNKQVK